jgi:hypothetical protein
MIDNKYLETIRKNQIVKKWQQTSPFVIFLVIFIISYKLDFKYSENTNLFNDKLIDVCSIFFGIFIGCLYLFEKFKSNSTYKDFLRFCRILLYQNIIIIALSFVIILVNDILPENFKITKDFFVKTRPFVFSVYIGLFSVTLYNIFKFIRIILKILKSEK